jgi:predicted ABC-type ATPase
MLTRFSPTVYVFAGPNDAVKTTCACRFLPRFVRCNQLLNADLIAAGLAPFAPETQALRAGRLLPTWIRELAAARAISASNPLWPAVIVFSS